MARRFHSDFTGAFGFFSYIVLAVVFCLAVGVFLYGQILSKQQSAKDAQLTKAESSIDPKIVQGFVRLRDRLSSGKQLLTQHVAFSTFFTALDALIPSTIRFSSLNLSLNDDGSVKLTASGVAKNFNALANASTVFAQDSRFKDAIFAGIAINPKDSTVSFSLSATADSSLVAFSP